MVKVAAMFDRFREEVVLSVDDENHHIRARVSQKFLTEHSVMEVADVLVQRLRNGQTELELSIVQQEGALGEKTEL